MVDYPDIINYTRDELLDEFCKLFDRYQELRELNEADTQKIHDLKRSLDTATAAQSYLSQELEQYTNSECSQDQEELQKTVIELAELRKRYSKLETSFNTLQQDHNALLEENATLTLNLEEASKRKGNESVTVESRISEDDLQRIQMLETENMDLLQQMEDFQEQTVRYTLTIAECEKNIEILRDQINCLEENLQSKKADLEEKVQILESTQEQLSEANAQIAMLSASPDNNDRKGNSLFAEVDDQRQVMKHLLTSQKKSYLQMKKIYNESEHEIRRLKRENIAMHTELEACSSIFCNADKVYQEKLNERVRHLLNQNEDLERKLKWTQERLNELASEKGVLWLDSMLNFCKKETDDLKKQLHSVRIQKASLEEQLRNSQQDLARWRFESLKSRCILLDREQLLSENKIEFKPVKAIEFKISEKEQNEARPRIVSSRRSATFDHINRRSMTPLKAVKDETPNAINIEIPTKQKDENANAIKVEIPPKQKDENANAIKVEILSKQTDENPNAILVEIPTKPKGPESQYQNTDVNNITEKSESVGVKKQNAEIQNLSGDANKSVVPPLNASSDEQELLQEKENCMPLQAKFSKLTVNPPSPMRPSQRSVQLAEQEVSNTPPARSILTKQRDLFSKEPCKKVKFSSKEDLIHNFSPNTPSPTGNAPPSSSQFCDKVESSLSTPTAKISSKAVVKQTRTKSNIVVRRVFVGSKHN